MSNDINELRSVLFDTLRGLKSGALDIDRAKTMSDVAQTIINTAKVEIDHIRIAGGNSSFIATNPEIQSGQNRESIKTMTGTKTITNLHGIVVTRHKMEG